MRAPRNEAELLERAHALQGRALAWIAERLDAAVPADLRRDKGWVGTLLESALGATGGAAARRDFPELGIELKTIPVDGGGRPRESTFVCVASLDSELLRPWRESWLCAKLARVLWIPVIGGGPPGERRVGTAVLWSPSPAQEAVLRADWEELTERLGLGHFDDLDARWGTALQVRPKAADSHARTWALDADAQWVQVNPRGFYLRAGFTRQLLEGAD
ncbi:MAG: DNA mismatch repair endonuclease MutH [bacterium]